MTTTIERDGPVTTIVRARTHARNAMDPASAEALVDALLAFDRDPDQSVTVLWGAGGAFCAGFDLKFAATQVGKRQPLSDLDFPEHGPPPRGPMGPSRLELSKPVIAAIAGPAVAGGMELALWCDLRVMEETAFMGADRRSVLLQEGLSEREGLRSEWASSSPAFEREGAAGAARFAQGKGRHGDFADI